MIQSGRSRGALIALSHTLLFAALPACEGTVDGQAQLFLDAGANKGSGRGPVSPLGSGGTDSATGGTSSGTGGFGTGPSATGGSSSGGSGTGGSGTGGDGTGGIRPTGTGGVAFGGVSGSGGQSSRLDAGVAQDGPADSDGGTTPTWTQIYTKLLNNAAYTSNCTGAACHNPGTQKNIRLSTSALGYTSIRALVTPGSATAGNLLRTLTSGAMPRGRPKMPTTDLDKIKAWIVAGALNN